MNNCTLKAFIVTGKSATEKGNNAINKIEIKNLKIYDGEQDNYPYYIYLEQKKILTF